MCACVLSCPLRLGDAQRIACDELVRSEECTCCPRICATAVTHMDPALLHRMNDLIQGRRITPQLLTSCLTFNVNYQDYQELNDLRQLTKAINASTLSEEERYPLVAFEEAKLLLHRVMPVALRVLGEPVVMGKSILIKVLISIAQEQEIEIRNLRLENRGLELLNNDLESQLERIRSRLRDLNLETWDNPEDDVAEIR